MGRAEGETGRKKRIQIQRMKRKEGGGKKRGMEGK